MANHASAEKRNRQRIRRTVRNRTVKSAVRTKVKRARTAIVGGAGEATAQALLLAIQALDRAAAKGIIPVRRASRVKGRLTKQVHALNAR